MGYAFQNRIRHNSERFAEINTEDVMYISGMTRKPIKASPILISPEELSAGNESLVVTTRQDWAVDLVWLTGLFPPTAGNKIIRADGSEFIVSSMGTDEPPYTDITSARERIIIHTVRGKR